MGYFQDNKALLCLQTCKFPRSHLHIITLKGADDMSRAKEKINVILHPPTNEKDIAAIQEAFGELYAHIIEKELAKHDLTYEEKVYIFEKVCEQLAG